MKLNKKGFTLVEIIIVLVIMAILAAIAVPSMLGFVKKAEDQQYIAEARAGYLAAQAIATEVTATSGTPIADWDAEIKKYMDADNTVAGKYVVTVTGSKVTKITYTTTKTIVTIENGKVTTAKAGS